MRNICVKSRYTWLKATVYKNLVSFSPFSAFDVKPLYTDWYRRPGDLINPWSHFNIPNDCNIEKTCVSCFDGETALLWICCPQFNLWFHNGCYKT